MKYFFILLVPLFFCCTGIEKNNTFPLACKPKALSVLSPKNNLHLVEGKPYDGFLYEFYPGQKKIFSIEGYLKGLLDGVSKKYYPSEKIMEWRLYRNGAKNGKQISFWENGNKRFEFIAVNDAYEGELKEWSENGKLIHLAHFKNGQEEGEQKLWYDNGKIRANYVIKNGRRYGLLGTKNCKNASEAVFVVK